MNWLKCLCPSGMWPPAVLGRRGSRLLPAGRPHLVQGLQRSPHPGPLGQNLHRLLTDPLRLCHFFLKPLPLSQIHEQLHINDSTDKKRSSFVQSYFFLFFFFPPTCLLWVLINFAVGPSGGIRQQFHFFFCYFDEATTSFHPEVLLHFPSFLVHMFSSVINSGLTCRQLGLHLPFIHTGTAQQLACTLLLSLSKTMNVWKDIIDLDLRSGRWCFFRREVA